MTIIKVTLELDNEEFSILNNIKQTDLDSYIMKIFKTGYKIHFPSNEKIDQVIEYNGIIEKIENIKDEIKSQIDNSEINDKISSLESSLMKLIGISSNSSKKGNFGENILEEIFNNRYGDIKFERKNHIPHSGDAWLHLNDDKIIMLESKNYTCTVNKDEIIKLQSDMITHHIKWGILVSFNSMIQGMKELDFHTFSHNNETYSVIMISNLSNDIHKLDLGLQILRKLIQTFDNLEEFPWIVQDINTSLVEINKIVQKNYILRDSYYTMEQEIQKQLSNYHVIIRDYQYDIEKKISEITGKIQSTLKSSLDIKHENNEILELYKDKKISSLLIRLLDTFHKKKWILKIYSDNEYLLYNQNDNLGKIKIQLKKIVVNIFENDIIITLNIGKEKENKKNIDIINSI